MPIPPNIKMLPVQSSNIRAVGWDNDVLLVTFHSGSTYKYDDVPEEIYRALLSAPSKGKYFCKNIRMAYDYEQVG
jgi:hypothetical protein